MAIGRIKRRNAAPTTPQSSPLCSTVSVTIIAVIVFCSLTFELSGKHDPATRDTCHSKCNNQLQQSASIPSAMNALFQSQGMFDQQQKSILQGNGKSSAAAARPRRLPTLIKILTGFGDEHQRSSTGHYYEDNDRPIIVRRIDRQEFIDQSKSDNPTQQAAVAAAAAVFSQSLRVYGNHRMKNVNAEWQDALVWIAGWDHNQMAQPSPSSNRGNNRGYNSTEDMEKSLEECIKQCIDDKDSDITAVTLEEDKRSSEDLEMHGSIGESTLSSFFDWVTSFSFSKLPLRTMVTSESLYILTKTFQLVASSMAMYALHSIWVWTSPVISAWYTSLGYTESPEWLLEHERELQQAKSSRARQRKKSKSKRRQQQTRKAAKQDSKQTPIKEEVQVHQKEDPIDKNVSNRDYLDSNHLAKNRVSPPPDPKPREEEHEEVQVPVSKADDSSSQLSEGIPSLITYSTTSASIYSPSFKPLHGDDRNIPQESLLHSKTTLQGPVFPHLPLNGLSVPTQEQREKAANQLREFQAAQIQKLLLKKKKLAQSTNSGISFPTTTSAQSMTSIQPKKVMRPPPGFSQPSESILPTQNDDTGGFLSNNEVFLSKLLDEEEDDGDKKTGGVKMPITSIYNAPSLSPEPQSSLNPAAAPFIGSNIEDDQVTSTNVSKMKKEDSWQSKPSDISFKDTSHVGGIKGVYGGSVW